MLAVAARVVRDGDAAPRGVYHVAGAGHASWYDMARRLFEVSRAQGGPAAEVERATAGAYATSAPRLANARLDCTRLRDTFGIALPHWSDSLATCVTNLVGDRD